MPPAFWREPFLDMATSVWAMPEEFWIDDSPRFSDTDLLEKHAAAASAIDEGNFREAMLAKWKEGTDVNIHVRELPGRTRVVFLGTEQQWSEIPWAFWSRIFQAVDHPIGHVLLYADPRPRVDPAGNRELEAGDINGGYSYICKQELVVIYRFEEATRVLLHELLHTLCFDSEKGVEDCEAHTEAWTELFLCALLSRGSQIKFNKLWKQQVDWMAEQAASLQVERNVNTPKDYAWRYMLGKKAVLEEKGFLRGFVSETTNGTSSLRFTTPLWDTYMT